MAVLLASNLWAAGCSTESRPETSAPVSPAPVPVLTEHRFHQSLGSGKKGVGEDCTRGGQAECATGLCLHVGARHDAGYVCSQRCETQGQCPAGWGCGRMLMGDPASSVCIPSSEAR
ncbi:hypothetical protein ACLESO_35965 [Pyxidicoccus sp. 3LG]